MNNIVRDALNNRPETNNIPDYSDGERTDFDYANFEAFLDPDKKTRMSKTEKEAMAEQYGLDVQGMTQLAMNALNNRPEKETPEEFVIPNIPE
jgi:replication initiation and membrane attachment protein DnaB